MSIQTGIRLEEHWLLTLAETVSAKLKRQDTSHVCVLEQAIVRRETQCTFVNIGALRKVPSVSLELALQPRTEMVFADREFIAFKPTRDVAAWFSAARPIVERLAKLGNRVYPSFVRYASEAGDIARPLELYRLPSLDVAARGPSRYGLVLNCSAPPSGRAPNPLLLNDIALFFLQVGRVASGLQPIRASARRYRPRDVPGSLVSMPGKTRALSRFRCPQCPAQLESYEVACSTCEWQMKQPHLRTQPSNSPYSYEYVDDT